MYTHDMMAVGGIMLGLGIGLAIGLVISLMGLSTITTIQSFVIVWLVLTSLGVRELRRMRK